MTRPLSPAEGCLPSLSSHLWNVGAHYTSLLESFQVSTIAGIVGSAAGVASWVERRPQVLALRLALQLRTKDFASTSNSDFSDLSRLVADHQRPFSRISLEKQLVKNVTKAVRDGHYCIIVGGPGGIGKSVFWESFFKKRPVQSSGVPSVWTPLPGPTRVLDLLKCKDVASFEAQVVNTFVPTPVLPSFGLSEPPSYVMALDVLQRALLLANSASLNFLFSPQNALLVYLEDANRLAQFDKWQDSFVPLAKAVASGGNGLVIGNSSALLAYIRFEALSHTGLRTSRFFFPSLSSSTEEMSEFLKNGGRLYVPGYEQPTSNVVAPITDKSHIWNGNLVMLKHGTSDDEFAVRIRIGQCLTSVNVLGSRWSDLINSDASPDEILALRMQLLQLLADSPNHEIPWKCLPPRLHQWKIVEQLAAIGLVTFRTTREESEDENVVVCPYYPAVITEFKRLKEIAVVTPS
jgi:hypothetical protein